MIELTEMGGGRRNCERLGRDTRERFEFRYKMGLVVVVAPADNFLPASAVAFKANRFLETDDVRKYLWTETNRLLETTRQVSSTHLQILRQFADSAGPIRTVDPQRCLANQAISLTVIQQTDEKGLQYFYSLCVAPGSVHFLRKSGNHTCCEQRSQVQI